MQAAAAAGNLPGSCIAAAGRALLPVSLNMLCGTTVMMVLVSVHAASFSAASKNARSAPAKRRTSSNTATSSV